MVNLTGLFFQPQRGELSLAYGLQYNMSSVGAGCKIVSDLWLFKLH